MFITRIDQNTYNVVDGDKIVHAGGYHYCMNYMEDQIKQDLYSKSEPEYYRAEGKFRLKSMDGWIATIETEYGEEVDIDIIVSAKLFRKQRGE